MFSQKEYNKKYYQEHKEDIKAHVRERYNSLKDTREFKDLRRAQREQQHFGVTRSVIFRKTNGMCHFCKAKEAQVVHHLDNDGRNNEAVGKLPGQDIDRLVPACRACHIDLHRDAMLLMKKLRANGYWSRHWECCIECGTTKIRHQYKGLCNSCRARQLRQQKESS